jgi:hypothetical protein
LELNTEEDDFLEEEGEFEYVEGEEGDMTSEEAEDYASKTKLWNSFFSLQDQAFFLLTRKEIFFVL